MNRDLNNNNKNSERRSPLQVEVEPKYLNTRVEVKPSNVSAKQEEQTVWRSSRGANRAKIVVDRRAGLATYVRPAQRTCDPTQFPLMSTRDRKHNTKPQNIISKPNKLGFEPQRRTQRRMLVKDFSMNTTYINYYLL